MFINKKEITIRLPDKEPGEEPATKKQIDYIRYLQKDIFLPKKLGKWQASLLIDKIKDTQYETMLTDEFHEHVPEIWIENEKHSKIFIIVLITVALFVLYLCVDFRKKLTKIF